MTEKDNQKRISWSANFDDGGNVSVNGHLMGGNFSKLEKVSLLASAVNHVYLYMEKKGYLKSELLSSSDIARIHGKTRQYWEKMLSEGKILYRETSAGRITTNFSVNEYIKNKEEVDEYVKRVKKVIKLVNEKENKSDKIKCPACLVGDFEHHKNYNNINGICRSCNFYVNVTN